MRQPTLAGAAALGKVGGRVGARVAFPEVPQGAIATIAGISASTIPVSPLRAHP
jgi:hypothetical protein